uniref:Nucleotide-diphospho-sugar transferase domain-containing protein n=1 Tax=Calcidiscus leptoporus TaxID=127549 RepID=A0A7S0JI40_9EUKA|mmetsp:Transcript_6015/g.13948  ORF Transcript_6015/g.13948 Transcript_6015/m.13948 type:complete len:372 (+) Transcript_6015:86-1201(+)
MYLSRSSPAMLPGAPTSTGTAQLLATAALLTSNASYGCHRNLTMVTTCTADSLHYEQLCAYVRHNFAAYARKHSYGLRFFDTQLLHTARGGSGWSKLAALLSVLSHPQVDYAFWVDSDSIFLNFELPLDGLLPAGEMRMTITGDHNCMFNAGVFLLRNSDWARQLLLQAYDVYPAPRMGFTPEVLSMARNRWRANKDHVVGPQDFWEGGDQEAIMWLLTGRQRKCRDNIALCCDWDNLTSDVRPLLFNRDQRAMNSYLYNYRQGDLLVHMAGEKKETKVAVAHLYVGHLHMHHRLPWGQVHRGDRFCPAYFSRGGGCAWTSQYACPALKVRGTRGFARANPDDLGFHCCCRWAEHQPPRAANLTCDKYDDK